MCVCVKFHLLWNTPSAKTQIKQFVKILGILGTLISDFPLNFTPYFPLQNECPKWGLQYVKLIILICFFRRMKLTIQVLKSEPVQLHNAWPNVVFSEVNFRVQFAMVEPNRSLLGWFLSLLPSQPGAPQLSLCQIWGFLLF